MEKSFTTTIDGYWRETNKNGLPSHSGVYFVYRSRYNPLEKTVTLLQLLYIGECADVCGRVGAHEKEKEWKRHLAHGEELCFSTCPVSSNDRERIEAAYIFKHKPPCNTEYTKNFPFDRTTISSTGKTIFLHILFTVDRT